jgi:hypothetical protein
LKNASAVVGYSTGVVVVNSKVVGVAPASDLAKICIKITTVNCKKSPDHLMD